MSGMSKGNADQRKLERHRAVRGGHRGAVTKLCRELDAIVEDGSFIIDSMKVSCLTIICEQLDAKWKALSTLDGEIVSLCPLTELERELNDSESIEVKLLETRHKISSYVRKRPSEAASTSPSVIHARVQL